MKLFLVFIFSAVAASAFAFFVTVDRQVHERLQQRQTSSVSSVLSDTYTLKRGVPVGFAGLRDRLEVRKYTDVSSLHRSASGESENGIKAGEFFLTGSQATIGLRSFTGADGVVVPATTVIVDPSSGTLTTAEKQPLEEAVLEPVLIAPLGSSDMRASSYRPLAQIPKHVQQAFLAIEDRRFYRHFGIDVLGILRAMGRNIAARRLVQGGSTLTQQLAKNILLTPRKTMGRKLREMAAAISLERRLTKDAILEMYLNEIFFAQEGSIAIHGVQEAAQNFFGKDVSDLSIAQGALLAGLVQAPTHYSPRRKLERAVERRNIVLGEMRDEKYITETQYTTAIKDPLKVTPALLRKKNASHFIASLERELSESYSVNTDIPAGINVYTSIDTELQRCAEKALQESIAKLEQSNPQLKKKGKPLEQALVAMDPATGAVRAWVGGRDFSENQFDHVRQARRQIGSTIKPFLYLTSLDGSLNSYRVASTVSILSDEPTGITLFNHKEWRPENYDHKYMGDVTLRYALEHSLNIPAVYVAQRVGIAALAHTLERFHISDSIPKVPALALGALDTSLFRLTSGYSALAHGGVYVEPHLFDVVRDSHGGIVAQPTGTAERVAEDGPVYVVTDIMRGVINKGTATVIRKLGFQGDAAGKTGTSNETRDAWFVGFTPKLAVGIWSGYDDNKQIGLTGGVVAAPTWARFMQCAQEYIGGTGAPFTMPDSVEKVRLDKDRFCRVSDSFIPEHTIDEVFVRGTAPEEICSAEPPVAETDAGDERQHDPAEGETGDYGNEEGQYPGVDMGETRLPRGEPIRERDLDDETQDELYQ